MRSAHRPAHTAFLRHISGRTLGRVDRQQHRWARRPHSILRRRRLPILPHSCRGGQLAALEGQIGGGGAYDGYTGVARMATDTASAAVAAADGDDGLHEDEGAHYDTVNQAYHKAFFYTGEYEDWQKQNILRRLELRPGDRLVDIGGGTGRFASLLHGAAGLTHPALCVDPSAGMLEVRSHSHRAPLSLPACPPTVPAAPHLSCAWAVLHVLSCPPLPLFVDGDGRERGGVSRGRASYIICILLALVLLTRCHRSRIPGHARSLGGSRDRRDRYAVLRRCRVRAGRVAQLRSRADQRGRAPSTGRAAVRYVPRCGPPRPSAPPVHLVVPAGFPQCHAWPAH